MAKPVSAAGVLRAAVAIFYCIAAIVVFFHLSSANHWSGISVRAPIFAIVPWAYTSKWKNRLVSVLSVISVSAIAGAFLLVVSPALRNELPPPAENILGAVALAALVGAIAVHAWLAFCGWRADRKRLRESSRTPLERASVGF